MAGSASKKYLSVLSVKKSVIGTKVNFMGQVIEIGIPKSSRGTDHFVTLKVVDDTVSPPGLSVNVFENLENLPKVRAPGDIISFHSVELQIFKGFLHCTSKKQSSSFALFDGKAGGNLMPYQTSATKKYIAEHDDEELVMKLRVLTLIFPQEEENSKLSLLSNIELHKMFDLVCKVVYVQKTPTDDWIVFIWDGTYTPHVALQTELDMEAAFPVYSENSILPRDLLLTIPKLGSIVAIFVDKTFEGISQLLELLDGSNHWVKFYNISFNNHLGEWKGFTHRHSKIRVISHEISHVLYRQNIYRDGPSYLPRPSSVTVTYYDKLKHSTLRESLTYPNVLHVFKTVVRVVTAYPWRATKLCSPEGHYRVRLTLEDPTARIHAYIYTEDGDTFFEGHPSVEVLTKKMSTLLGIEESSSARNPPWISCCIKSYYLDPENPWTSRRFRIFATANVG